MMILLITAKVNIQNPEYRGVEPRLAALRLLGQVRNSRLPSLPFGRLFCSPGFHIAFACGEQPTGLIFGSFPTGGPRFLPFAQWSFKSLGAGLALPFALTNSGRFLLRRTAHWADASFVCLSNASHCLRSGGSISHYVHK